MTDTDTADAAVTEDTPDEAGQVAPADPPAIRHVPLSELQLEHKFWRNPRSHTGLDEQAIAELSASIKENTTSLIDGEQVVYAGIRHALEVVQIRGANDTIINLVIDGQRRFMAATLLKIPDILVPVIDLEPEPVVFTPALAAKYLTTALDTVGTRAGLSSFELSESAERLRSSKNELTGKDYTLAEIALVVHRSESWVSKMLKARASATPALLHKWKTAQITDEQFKDLAAARDPEHQQKEAEKVAEARQSGNKAEARTLAKEQKEVAKASATPKGSPDVTPKIKSAGSAAKPGADKADQQTSLPSSPPRRPPPAPIIEDMLAMADRSPPTSDYVKGIMDGLRYSRGLLDSSEFSKAWGTYLQHTSAQVAQNAKPDKSGKSDKKAKSKSKPAKKKSAK